MRGHDGKRDHLGITKMSPRREKLGKLLFYKNYLPVSLTMLNRRLGFPIDSSACPCLKQRPLNSRG